MSIFARIKAKNWFEGPVCIAMRSIAGRRIQSVRKNKKISTLTILILVSGCFFYNQISSIFPSCFANDYESEGYLENEREWVAKINYVEMFVEKKKEEQKKSGFMSERKEEKKPEIKSDVPKTVAKNVETEINGLVGNAPIREMVPYILKFDEKVGAFIIGIAKKESDWGRRAPSLSGKTCYNYWGYKGQGSRGTSMGYACFGSAEEAVEIVGKRIESLVSKNINNPQKFVVWKCGSSCAGHDPNGVQKWISDVGLYYGKVMQIQKS